MLIKSHVHLIRFCQVPVNCDVTLFDVTMKAMNRRLDHLKRHYAAWMLAAVFVWVMQPVGTSVFCHDDFAHDHSAHASIPQSAGHQHESDDDHDHDEAHDAFHEAASTPVQQDVSSELPESAHEVCCCQPQETPVTAVAGVSHSGSDGKSQVVSPSFAILSLTYAPEAPPTVASRAGPGIPSLYSLLLRSSFSNRAPPFSA